MKPPETQFLLYWTGRPFRSNWSTNSTAAWNCRISGRPFKVYWSTNLVRPSVLNLGWSTSYLSLVDHWRIFLETRSELVDHLFALVDQCGIFYDSDLNWSTSSHLLVDQYRNMPYAFLFFCRMVDQFAGTGRPVPAMQYSFSTVLVYRPIWALQLISTSATIKKWVVRGYH